MEPLEQTGTDQKLSGACVDQVEGPAVALDFFLRPVERASISHNQRDEPLR